MLLKARSVVPINEDGFICEQQIIHRNPSNRSVGKNSRISYFLNSNNGLKKESQVSELRWIPSRNGFLECQTSYCSDKFAEIEIKF